MKTLRPVHPSQLFHLSRLSLVTTHKPKPLHLLETVSHLLIQGGAMLLPLTATRSREAGPTFIEREFRKEDVL